MCLTISIRYSNNACERFYFERPQLKYWNYSKWCCYDVNMTVDRVFLCLFWQRTTRVTEKRKASWAEVLCCCQRSWDMRLTWLSSVLIGTEKISRHAGDAVAGCVPAVRSRGLSRRKQYCNLQEAVSLVCDQLLHRTTAQIQMDAM